MCERCDDLLERIAWLESELGIRDETEALEALRSAYGMPRGQALMLMRLYRANGHAVSKATLDDAIPMLDEAVGRDENFLKVYASRLRRSLGPDCIETVHAVGYRLTAAGLEKVSEILDAYRALRAAAARRAA